MRLDRIQAIDVHQGPLQRAFGVFAVDVQTGAGAKGGEISLPALTPDGRRGAARGAPGRRGRASRTRPTSRRGASPRASWRSPR